MENNNNNNNTLSTKMNGYVGCQEERAWALAWEDEFEFSFVIQDLMQVSPLKATPDNHVPELFQLASI